MPKFNTGDTVNIIDGCDAPADTDPRIKVLIKGLNANSSGKLYDFTYLEGDEQGESSWVHERWLEPIKEELPALLYEVCEPGKDYYIVRYPTLIEAEAYAHGADAHDAFSTGYNIFEVTRKLVKEIGD